MIERLRFEIVTAIRSLMATPLPVAAAIITLAVAAGLNLAMLGLIDRALLSPPRWVANPQEVVTLSFRVESDDGATVGMTTAPYATFTAIRDDVPSFAAAAAWQRLSTSVMVNGEQLRADAMVVSSTYFGVLGARPVLGRGLVPDDDAANAGAASVVLSHAFWQSAFGGDRGVLGQPMTVRGLDYVVAGVMPPGFSGHSSARVDVWLPYAGVMRNEPGWDRDQYRNTTSIVARIAAGANQSAAATQASAVSNRRVLLSPVVGSEAPTNERRIAWWLAGISVLVLVVGLANAGTLLLVRATRRRQEIAIRASLGASRQRLVSQAWMEAGVLALAATATSLIMAYWLDEAIRQGLFPALIEKSGLGETTWLTAAVVASLTTFVAGAVNGWHLPALVRVGESIALASGRRSKSITGLLVVQTTMAVLLVAGAGMFGSSFYKLAAQDFGMRMDDVLIVDAEVGPGTGGGPRQLYREALERVRMLPGVEAATIIDALPFAGFNVPPISVPGHAEPPRTGLQLPNLIAATPELFEILDIPIIEGRGLTAADDRGALVVIVNQAMAQQVWPGDTAIGKCIRIGFDEDFDPSAGLPPTPPDRVPCREVVGVARDIRQRSVLPGNNEDRLMQYYVPFSQVPSGPFAGGPLQPRGLLLRVSTTADALAPSIRRLVVGNRANLPYVRVQPYVRLLDRQMRPWRLGATLLAMFSAVALAVAALGLYAAFTHAVNERRREMAIRLAVGAEPRGMVRLVLRDALMVAAIGTACGTVAVMAGGRWVQSLLYETAPADPLVLLFAGGVMLAVAVLATLAPARAAARNDPSTLLRAE